MAIQPDQQPAKEKQTPYDPPGPMPLYCEKFNGVDQSTSRAGVPDEKCFWLENIMPLGDRSARTMPGKNVLPIFTLGGAGLTMYLVVCFNISSTQYAAVFLSDGEITTVNLQTGSAGTIAGAGTIVNGTSVSVGTAQYGAQYLLIVSSTGYFIWDGVTFYAPGGPAPPGDPFGVLVMPLGISGSTVEIYAGRVWIGSTATITYSSPGSLVDFSSAHGGGNFISTDSFLKLRFVRLLSTNGFLYLIADSSINYISGVQTGGTPVTTTFTNQNADAEIGSPYAYSVERFGRNILMCNSFGVHVCYGSDVKKVSNDIDNIWAAPEIGSAGPLPVAAQVTLYGRRVWVVLTRITSPIDGSSKAQMLFWDGNKKWWGASQEIDLKFIAGQEINSTFFIYGVSSDGDKLFKLFTTPSPTLQKTMITKFWDQPLGYTHTKATSRFWIVANYKQFDSLPIFADMENETSPANVQTYQIDSPSIGYLVSDPLAVGQQGAFLGYRVRTFAADVEFISTAISVQDAGYRG